MLSAQERAHVAQVWDLIAGHEAAFGAELLLSTKIYFKHLGVCPDEAQLLTHGQRVLEAVGVAVQHIDHLRAALSPLADLHAQVLRVDPANFPVSPPPPRWSGRPGVGLKEKVAAADPLSPAPPPTAADPVFPGGSGFPPAGRVHRADAGGVGQVLDRSSHGAD
uniref:Hemoglobin subunit mu n=1 Tax=Panthera leo TaxID=9689 RepID=A0A8C8Y0L4_PANLE